MIDEPSSYLDVRQRLKAAQVKNSQLSNGSSSMVLLRNRNVLDESQEPSIGSPTVSSAELYVLQTKHAHLVNCPLRKLLGYLPRSGRFHSKARAQCT